MHTCEVGHLSEGSGLCEHHPLSKQDWNTDHTKQEDVDRSHKEQKKLTCFVYGGRF